MTKAADCTCKCRKPRVDPDDIEDINDIDDQFVTPETAIHLQELKDEEEKPFRLLRSLMFWNHAKDYDENDKYKLHEPTPIEKELNEKIETVRSVKLIFAAWFSSVFIKSYEVVTVYAFCNLDLGSSAQRVAHNYLETCEDL